MTRIGGLPGAQCPLLQCTYRDPNRFPDAQVLEPINDLGNPNLRLLFSPGFLQEEE